MNIYKILDCPLITEKSQELMGQLKNQERHVFHVSHGANKGSVKQAIQKTYNVKVAKVNIIKIHRKSKKFRNQEVWQPRKKKAIVTLVAGAKIEIVKT